MPIARRFCPRLGALAAAILIAQPAIARDTPDNDARPSDNAVPTAQRGETTTAVAPMAVSRVDLDKLHSLTASGDDIRALSSQMPSLHVESGYGRIFPRFYVRGLGNSDSDFNASQPVAVIYDGVVQESPLLKGFPLFDMASIELDRGPQGVRVGRNASAGAIRFESVRPRQEFDGYGRFGYGSDGRHQVEGAVGGGFSDHIAARLSVLRQTRRDWIDNTYNGPGDDLGGYADTAARLQLLYAPDETFEALANVHARTLDGTSTIFRDDIMQRGSNDLVDGFPRERVFMDGLNAQRLHQTGASLRMRWELGGVRLYSITGYESVDAYSRGDFDGGRDLWFPGYREFGYGVMFPYEQADSLPRHRQWSQTFRLESQSPGHFQWQAGLDWFDERIRTGSAFFISNGALGRQFGGASTHQRDAAWSVFGSGDWKVTDRLDLHGGLRYSDERKAFDSERPAYALGQSIAPIRRTPRDHRVSWDLSAVYAAADGFDLYGRVATGYRAPSARGHLMFVLWTVPANDMVRVADSETVLSYEAGAKASFLDDRVRLDFALYRYAVEHPQLVAPIQHSEAGITNLVGIVNGDRAVGRGAELEVQARLTDRLQLAFGGSYNATEIQDRSLRVYGCSHHCTLRDPMLDHRISHVLVDGNSLPQAPKYIYNVTARYGMPLGHGELFAYTDWSYRSKVNFFLYDAVEFTGKPLLQGGLRLGYNWHAGDYEIALYGRNITDEQVVVNAFDLYGLTGALNEPRTWGAEFNVKF